MKLSLGQQEITLTEEDVLLYLSEPPQPYKIFGIDYKFWLPEIKQKYREQKLNNLLDS